MIVDIIDRRISLTDCSAKPYQSSQLKFWGFDVAGPAGFVFSGENLENMLTKIIKYFDNETIKYSLTDTCRELIEKLEGLERGFRNKKELGQKFKDGKFNEESFRQFSKFLATNIPRKLKPHQIKAAFHLYLVNNGANFSVPGSGKTSVVLSVYAKLRDEGKVNVLFVVGPPACFGPWKTEFVATLGREPNVKILSGGHRSLRKAEYFTNEENKAELYLTTFQTLINDQDELEIFFTQKGINVFLVVDEAHYIKQINGNWANAVLNVATNSKTRCVLTGTPLPRSFSDVFNLFDFLWPDNDPIDSSSRTRLQTFEAENRIEDARTILNDRVGPLFYRVRKDDLGLEPAKFHNPIILSMNTHEKTIYEAIERNIRSYATDDYLLNIDFISALKRGRMIRLRQTVSNAHLLAKSIENYDEDILNNEKDLRYLVREYANLELPSKLEFLVEKVTQLRKAKEKVVIWTNFVGTIELIENHFNDKLGFYARSIYGKTPIEQTSIPDELTREQIRDEFVDDDSGLDILIANPAACAESISLHKTCRNAIYYDLSYNCAQYLQSLDRIHRVGGSEETVANYFFLQYENTIDQDILRNLRRKADRMSTIIDQDYQIYSLDMLGDQDEELNAYDRLFGDR
jgi:SNF2 family DNA or RNA helicase